MTLAPPPNDQDSDWLLVQRTLSGDDGAFELLVIKYQRRVQRLVARLVRDKDLIEDIAQETFIKAYRALHQFRGESQFYTWLYRIAVNTAKQFLIQLQREPMVLPDAGNKDDDDETFSARHEPSHDNTPEAELAAKEIATMVNRALQALPEELRQAISLREMEGLSYEDIADIMNCPVGTVRSRIFRAREAISAKIRPMLDNQTGKRW